VSAGRLSGHRRLQQRGCAGGYFVGKFACLIPCFSSSPYAQKAGARISKRFDSIGDLACADADHSRRGGLGDLGQLDRLGEKVPSAACRLLTGGVDIDGLNGDCGFGSEAVALERVHGRSNDYPERDTCSDDRRDPAGAQEGLAVRVQRSVRGQLALHAQRRCERRHIRVGGSVAHYVDGEDMSIVALRATRTQVARRGGRSSSNPIRSPRRTKLREAVAQDCAGRRVQPTLPRKQVLPASDEEIWLVRRLISSR
jgi:hypothetical protein